MNSEQVVLSSLLRKLVSDPAVLTSAGSGNYRRAKTEKSCDFDDRPLPAHSHGGTRRQVEVVSSGI